MNLYLPWTTTPEKHLQKLTEIEIKHCYHNWNITASKRAHYIKLQKFDKLLVRLSGLSVRVSGCQKLQMTA